MTRDEIAEWLDRHCTENPCDDSLDILVAFEKYLTEKKTATPPPMKTFSVELFNYALPTMRKTIEVKAPTQEAAESIAHDEMDGWGVFSSTEV